MLKKILCSVCGALMSLMSLLCLISFILYVRTPRPLGILDPNPMPAAGYVFFWIAILGLGTGGFFLLRAAVRAFRGGADDDDEAYKGDYDDEDAP